MAESEQKVILELTKSHLPASGHLPLDEETHYWAGPDLLALVGHEGQSTSTSEGDCQVADIVVWCFFFWQILRPFKISRNVVKEASWDCEPRSLPQMTLTISRG